MEGNKQSNQFPIPGIALVILAIGVFVFADNPFKPTRPDAPSELTASAEDVRARLWQDPFAAVERHRNSKHKISYKSELKDYTESLLKLAGHDIREKKPITLKSGLTKNSKYQDQQHRVCIYKDDSSLSAHTIDELRCQIQRDVPVSDKETDLHVLVVMVPGGPYAEDTETRIRSRYAVISGLSNAGYTPSDAEHISYMDFTESCKEGLDGRQGNSRFCDWPATIPYEWFRPNNVKSGKKVLDGANKVLVLWLDDESISRVSPLQMLDRLRDALTPKENDFERFDYVTNEKPNKDVSVKLDVLGPDSSTTLLKMYEDAALKYNEVGEERRVDHGDEKNIRIFSHKATIDTSVIDGGINTESKIKKWGEEEEYLQDDRLVKEYKVKQYGDTHVASFDLIRTIPTDKYLVKALLCELVSRGVNPYKYDKDYDFYSGCDGAPEQNISFNKNKSQDHIVLIGEWDTVYSRSFNYLFRDQIRKDVLIKKEDTGSYFDWFYGLRDEYFTGFSKSIKVGALRDVDDDCPTWLHSYNYYRGIDGSIGSEDSKQKPSDKDNKDKSVLRRPVGENQFDYLRRLGNQIERLSNTLEDNREGNVRAIGIVGSDTYDKLLVLQALRNKFPQVLFFTTDLDARMLHAEENDWVRNLIVASGFGLTLNRNSENKLDDRQPAIPFRDAYQTSLYQSTLMAVHKNDKFDINDNVKIFEIGSGQAIDYSYMYKAKDTSWGYGLPLIFSIVLLLVIIYKKLHKSILYRIVLLLVISFSIAYFISIDIYYRLAILMLMLLVYQTNNKIREYLVVFSVIICSIVVWISMFDTHNSVEFQNIFSGTSIWPAVITRMFASVLAIVFIIYTLSGLRKNNNEIIERFGFDIVHDKGFYNRLCSHVKKHSFTYDDNMILIRTLIEEVVTTASNLIKELLSALISIPGLVWHSIVLSKRWIFGKRDSAKEKKDVGQGLSKWSRYFITAWCWRPMKKDTVNVHEFFEQYLELGRTRYWSRRVVSMFVLYLLVMFSFLFSFSSLPISPFHGDVSFKANQIAIFTVVFLYTFLIFLVVDVTRLNSRFVKLLFREECNFSWSEKYIHEYSIKYGVSESVAGEKLKFDMIVIRSKAVDILIFLPFVILTLMIISRYGYFDRWHMPAQLAVVIVMGACIALSSAIRLRRTAKKSRMYAIDNLEKIYKEHVYEEAKKEKAEDAEGAEKTDWRNENGICDYNMSDRIRHVINEIKLVHEGPFTPIAQHPIISAIAMPFGGVGGLYLIDYFANIGI